MAGVLVLGREPGQADAGQLAGVRQAARLGVFVRQVQIITFCFLTFDSKVRVLSLKLKFTAVEAKDSMREKFEKLWKYLIWLISLLVLRTFTHSSHWDSEI